MTRTAGKCQKSVCIHVVGGRNDLSADHDGDRTRLRIELVGQNDICCRCIAIVIDGEGIGDGNFLP